VPRKRFAPVKATSDLLLVMSDCFVRTDRETINPNPERTTPMPSISLDANFYKKIDTFLARFPKNPPSLLKCDSLVIEGDVLFEENVRCVGDVRLVNKGPKQAVISAGSVLQGETFFA